MVSGLCCDTAVFGDGLLNILSEGHCSCSRKRFNQSINQPFVVVVAVVIAIVIFIISIIIGSKFGSSVRAYCFNTKTITTKEQVLCWTGSISRPCAGGHDFWSGVAWLYQGLCWRAPREDAGDSMIPMTSDPEVPSYYGTLFMSASGK